MGDSQRVVGPEITCSNSTDGNAPSSRANSPEAVKSRNVSESTQREPVGRGVISCNGAATGRPSLSTATIISSLGGTISVRTGSAMVRAYWPLPEYSSSVQNPELIAMVSPRRRRTKRICGICPRSMPLPALAEINRPSGLNTRSCSDSPSATAIRPSESRMTPRTCPNRYVESAPFPMTSCGVVSSRKRWRSSHAGRVFVTMRTPALSRDEDCAESASDTTISAMATRSVSREMFRMIKCCFRTVKATRLVWSF